MNAKDVQANLDLALSRREERPFVAVTPASMRMSPDKIAEEFEEHFLCVPFGAHRARIWMFSTRAAMRRFCKLFDAQAFGRMKSGDQLKALVSRECFGTELSSE